MVSRQFSDFLSPIGCMALWGSRQRPRNPMWLRVLVGLPSGLDVAYRIDVSCAESLDLWARPDVVPGPVKVRLETWGLPGSWLPTVGAGK